MILIDMNQIMISNLMVQLKGDALNENLVRHMVLTALRAFEKQYSLSMVRLFLRMTVSTIGEKKHFLITNRIERKTEKHLIQIGMLSLKS